MEYKIARVANQDGSVAFGFTAGTMGSSDLWLRKSVGADGVVRYWLDVAMTLGSLVLYIYGDAEQVIVFSPDHLAARGDSKGCSIPLDPAMLDNLLKATRLGVMSTPLPTEEAFVNRIMLTSNGPSLIDFQIACRMLMAC